MTYVNLTPHPINIYGPNQSWPDDPELVIPPSGTVARVATIDLGNDGYGHHLIEYGYAHDLPAKVRGRWLIVSLVVTLACPGRDDLVAPFGEVRNADGVMVGCRALQRVV